MSESESGYWNGPYDVLVPSACRVVPEPDGNCRSNVSITEVMYYGKPTSQTEYYRKYCKQRADGKWVVVFSPPCKSCGFADYRAEN